MNDPQPEPVAIRVLVIAPQALTRETLSFYLQTRPEIRLLGSTGDPEQALALAAALRPPVILLDLGRANGADPAEIARLSEASPESRLIVLTDFYDPLFLLGCVQNGARGIFLKSDSCELLLKAIVKVSEGELWLNRSLMSQVLEQLQQDRRLSHQAAESPQPRLTRREQQIIELVCCGRRAREIAVQLSLSESTIRHHLTNIYRKLGLADRLELALYALAHGLIGP